MAVLQASRSIDLALSTGAPADVAIGSITYRSRANGRPDWRELDALTRGAQQRNRAAGLTGTLVYEDGRFFQCLEGPPAELEPVWQSIQSDPRHREIEILSMRLGTARMFDGWDMRWLRRGQQAGDAGTGLGFLEPAAPSALLAGAARTMETEAFANEVRRRHPHASLGSLIDYVVEPTARALGDAWMEDEIDEAMLAIALGRLIHVVHDRARTEPARIGGGRRLLAVTLPGEPHLLGAVAMAERHLCAGWRVDLEFPARAVDLTRLVAATAYDRLDIATSDAIDRIGARTAATSLAAALRRMSRNPAIEISFGGRAFWRDDAGSGLDGCRFRSSAATLAV